MNWFLYVSQDFALSSGSLVPTWTGRPWMRMLFLLSLVISSTSASISNTCILCQFSITNFSKGGQRWTVFDPHLAADVLDLGPEAGDLPHAVRNLPRGQALHNLVQLSEALKSE